MNQSTEFYLKNERKLQFQNLKEQLPGYQMPKDLDSLSLKEIDVLFHNYSRLLHMNRDIDQLKIYLVFIWLGIEFVGTYLGLNFSGFTIYQIRDMHKYEYLLLELNEVNFKNGSIHGTGITANWSVYARIAFNTVLSVLAFLLVKLIGKWSGEAWAIKIMTALETLMSGQTRKPQPVQKMTSSGRVVIESEEIPARSENLDVLNNLATLGSTAINFMGAKKSEPAPKPSAPVNPKVRAARPAYTEDD